ncbi:sodium channel and clathrin linker 1 isoform X1 [Pleurodeles waltl]|uniref:sodium channel and clathrin linker 1 isoform X1 n=2 Tax=Pleurodeles waltl TaxID=8319 RepID=UPI003709869F
MEVALREVEMAAPDGSSLAPLIGEYDNHMEEMSKQLQYYQAQMGEMRLKVEKITRENERLHQQLREAVERQLESMPDPTGLGHELFTEEEIIKNLQEQLQLANQEKEQALELWQTVAQELDEVQHQYQEQMTEAQIHVHERQKHKEQLTSFQQLTRQLQEANERVELTNQQFLQTVTGQNMEMEQLRKQLREAKVDLRIATTKVEEMTKMTCNYQEQIQRKEEDVVAAQGREEASDRRLQQLQTAVTQLEARLRVAAQDAEQLRSERTSLEKQIGELQAKCAELEEEKYVAVERVRDSMQLLEEANLQKDEALLKERQKEAEIEKMKEALVQIIQEAAVRTRKEVENARKDYNVQIFRITEELSALQMECGDKQSQIERAIREKRAAEEELEKVYREGRENDGDVRKLEVLHQRCLLAERSKDDLQISLQTAKNKVKQLEINFEEEVSRCQERIQKLQKTLESERENSTSVSEERLKLQQQNEKLRKEVEEWKKTGMEAQQKAKFQICTMQHEYSVKEQGFEIQLKELEDSNRSSANELRRLLMAQQKATNRWREETRMLTEGAESRLNNLRSELSQQKHRTQELLSQLESATEKVVETIAATNFAVKSHCHLDAYEKLMTEYQEKTSRLQRRLIQAEQRAASASQQLHRITAQRRKAASTVDIENI